MLVNFTRLNHSPDAKRVYEAQLNLNDSIWWASRKVYVKWKLEIHKSEHNLWPPFFSTSRQEPFNNCVTMLLSYVKLESAQTAITLTARKCEKLINKFSAITTEFLPSRDGNDFFAYRCKFNTKKKITLYLSRRTIQFCLRFLLMTFSLDTSHWLIDFSHSAFYFGFVPFQASTR